MLEKWSVSSLWMITLHLLSYFVFELNIYALKPNLGHGHVGLQLVYLRPQPTLMWAVYYVASSQTDFRGGQSQASMGGAWLAPSLWGFRITWVLAQRVRWSLCFALPWSWDGSTDWNIMLTSLPIPSVRTSCFALPCTYNVSEVCARCCHVVFPLASITCYPDKPKPSPLLDLSTLRSQPLAAFVSSVRALFPYNNVASFVCVSVWGKMLCSLCPDQQLHCGAAGAFIRVHCPKAVIFTCIIVDRQVCVE